MAVRCLADPTLQEMSGKALTASIARLGKGGQWQAVLQLLKALYRKGSLPNVISVNAALTACSRNAAWALSLVLLQHLEAWGPEPDTVSCGAGIHACSLGSWFGALQLLQQMCRWSAEPTTTTFNEALNAVEQGRGRWQGGLGLAESMAALRVENDVITKGSLACTCSRSAQWAQALGLSRGSTSAALVGGIISSCTSSKRWPWAIESLLCLRQTRAEVGSLVICRGSVLKPGCPLRSFFLFLCPIDLGRVCSSQKSKGRMRG